MDVEYFQWLNGLLLDYSHIKRGVDEAIPNFHVIFINACDKIPPRYQPRSIIVDYAFVFDPKFHNLFWSQEPKNLKQAFLVAKGVEEVLTAARKSQGLLVATKEHSDGSFACYQVSIDEHDDDDSCLGDQEPVVAKLEPCIKFHENEAEELNVQVGLLVPFSGDDKIQEKEKQISHA